MEKHRARSIPAAIMATTVAILALATAPVVADTLEQRDGTLLEGRYAGGTGDIVQFDAGGLARHFPVGVVARIVFSPRGTTGETGGAGASPAPPEAVAAEGTITMRLRDGSVYKGSYRGGTGDLAWFQTLGVVRGFPVGGVESIEFVPPAPVPAPSAQAAAPGGPAPVPGGPAAAPPAPSQPADDPAASPAGGAPGPKKSFFGGGFGFGYGDISWFEVWPVFGYRVAKNFTAGVEVLYRVREDNRYAQDITATDYGVTPFVRLDLARGLFLQAEYEFLSYEYADTSMSTDRDTYDSFLMGIGLSRPMGGHAAFVLSAFYNFSYSDDDPFSPYDEAWTVSAGVGFGF